MKTTSGTTAWFLAGALLTGISADMARAGSGEIKEELHETYALTPDGRVSLDNVNGSVHITTWDRTEVKLDAIKKADSQDAMDDLEIQIKTNGTHVRIHTMYPDSKHRGFFSWGNNAWVEYELTVPTTARLKDISTVNGEIEIEGVRGDVKAVTVNGAIKVTGLAGRAELSTVNGRVKADFASLDGVKSVSASTVNGSVELNLPAGANADVSANTVNGGIRGDVPVKKHWPVGASANAKLGEGGTKVSASTVNGGIQLHVAKSNVTED
jgi:hypothetical protein